MPCNNVICKAPWPNTDESRHTPIALCKGNEEWEVWVPKAIWLFHCGASSGLRDAIFQVPPSHKQGKPSSSCRLHTDDITVSSESSSVVMISLGKESTPCLCQLLLTVLILWPISFLKIKLGPVWPHPLLEIYGGCRKASSKRSYWKETGLRRLWVSITSSTDKPLRKQNMLMIFCFLLISVAKMLPFQNPMC